MAEWKPPASDAVSSTGWQPPATDVIDPPKQGASTPMTTSVPEAAAGPSTGSGMQQAASQEQPGTLMDPSQLGSALDAATKPVQGPPSRFQGYDAQYPGVAPTPAPVAGIEPPAPTNKKPREFAYGEGGFVQKPDGTTVDARDARIERDFADRQGVYSTLNLPGASQYSPQREQAMRDAGTWSDSDELRKKQAPLIIQSDLLRRKQEQLDNDIEKYGIAKVEEQASMLGQDLTYLGEELKKMQESGNADPAAFNEMAAQYNEKLETYKQQAEILKPFIEEQQDIQGGFEYLQSKHAQAEKEFAQSPTQKTKAARQAMADERFAAAENDIRQGNYLTGNVLDQYVVSPVTATVTSSVLKAAGALGRSLDAWVNIPNAVTGDEANYSRFGSAADNLFDAAEELAPTPKQASQPIFDKEWNMDTHALLPKAMQAATYMAMLGVSGAAAGEPGMVAAGYMTTEEDYYKEAIGVGMKPGEATAFSMTSAALTSLLEKVNPGPLLNGKTVKGAMLERVTKALRDGKNWKEAVKDGTQYVVKEGLGEGGQELLQAGGDDLTKGSAKLAIGERADGLEMNTAQAYAENALLGLSMGTLAAIGGRAMDRPLHMQSLDWAVRNRQKVEDYIKKSGRKDADVLLERLDKISRVYAGNNLTAMPPEQSAKVASLVEQKNDAEKEVKEKPMDPVLEAAMGNPAKQKVNELTTAMIEAMGIPTDKAKAALIGMGMEKAPEGTKAVTNPDGSVTLEKKPETGGATAPTATASAPTAKKQEPTTNAVASVFSADEATGVDEEPTAAPAESSVVDVPVSTEAAILSRDQQAASERRIDDMDAARVIAEQLSRGKKLAYGTRGDGSVYAGHDVGERQQIKLDMTQEERREFRNAEDDLKFASTPEERTAANARIQAALIEPTKRRIAQINEGSTTATEAPAAQAPEDTGDPAGVPPAPEPAARFEPVLTQDVQDDRVSLAAAYEQARMEYRSDMNPDYVIDGILRGAVNEDSFYRFGDRNTKSGPMAKTYFAKKSSGRHMEKSGKTMDVLAQEASEATGREVSPNDLVAHMNQYGSGLPMTNARMRELDQRHGSLYGTKLNKLVAKSILAKNKGKVPKFTPSEQAIVDRAEEEGVPLEAVDDQDIEDFDNQSDEDADIMFSGGPSTTYKFDPNAKRGTEQVQPGATPEDAGAVRGDESQGTPRAADKERQALTDQVEEAKAARTKFEKDFKKRAQSLFDTGEVQTRKEAQVKKAPEPGLFQADGDTRATGKDDFAKAVKPYDDAVASAEKALDEYDNKTVPAKAQAAAQQTSIGQAPATPANMTEASVINRDYRKLKEDLGEKNAKKYFEQVDRLFNPNSTRVVEYRKNGVVTESDGKRTFHALADMDSKKWRVSFSSGIEDVSPSNDTKVGKNAAGEQLYDRADGSRYRMRFDRKDRPSGYPDFGGDLSPVEAPAQAEAPLPKKKETTYEAKARKAAEALENWKLKGDKLYALPLPPSVWNGAITAMQDVIVAGGKAADAIAAAIKHIQNSDWWKNKATQKEKDEVIASVQGRQAELAKSLGEEEPAPKAKEPPPAAPKAAKEPSEPKEVKKTFTTVRAYEGDFRQEVKAELAKGGLYRDIENQEEAEERADAFIVKVGIDAALQAARTGDVRGGARSVIVVRALEDLDRQYMKAKTPERMAEVLAETAELIQWRDRTFTEIGRETSMMARMYEKSELGFTVAARTSDWKKKTGEEPTEDQIKRWKEVEAEMNVWKEKWAEAEKRAEEAQAVATLNAIQDSVSRQKAANRKTTPAQKSKVLADKIRTLKIGQPGVMRSTTMVPELWDTAVEAVAQTVQAGGNLATAIQIGLNKIRESEWYKKLKQKEQEEAEASFSSAIEDAMADDVEVGPLRIPKQMIRDAVEAGAKDIDSLVAVIKGQIKEEYPDATDRQIRDAITEYGKVVNLNKDELSTEVRRIKRIGRIVSALEDVANKIRPLRSGLQRDKLDAEERALNKELREALKDLPVDAEAQARELRTALDAAKTRARNRIEDLQREIDTKQRTPRSTTRVEADAELEALIAEKKELEKEHDAIFGDKSLTEEERLKRAIDSTRRSVEALDQKIRDKDIDPAKPATVPETPELKALRERRAKLREEYRKMQEEAGVIDRRRLDTAKKVAKARIQELERRIDQGDFSKKEVRPPVMDNELIRLQAEKMRLKEEYDKELYKHKLLNRTNPERVKDALWEFWGLTRALRATGELSFVLIQGGSLTISNMWHKPGAVGRAFKTMWQAMRSEKKSEEWLRKVKSQDWYPLAKEAKLAITEPHAELSAREELFMSDWLKIVWNVLGSPLKPISKEAYKKWTEANPMRAIERGASAYLDTLRIERFMDGMAMLEKNTGTPPSKEELKDIADVANTLTGRATIGGLEKNSTFLTKLFFSPRLWASAIKTGTPYAFIHFGKMTPTARKMAVQDLGRYIGTTMGFVAMAAAYLNNDDDDETGVETDPRSSDFGKIKIGNKYIDPWGGRIQQLVFSTRMTIGFLSLIAEGLGKKPLDAYKDRRTGELSPLGQGMTPTMGETILRMGQNKLAPSAGIVAEYMMTKVRKDGTRTSFGKPYDLSDELVGNLYPIYVETLSELAKEDPGALEGFLALYAFAGGGVNVDEPKEPKERVRPARPERPERPTE